MQANYPQSTGSLTITPYQFPSPQSQGDSYSKQLIDPGKQALRYIRNMMDSLAERVSDAYESVRRKTREKISDRPILASAVQFQYSEHVSYRSHLR